MVMSVRGVLDCTGGRIVNSESLGTRLSSIEVGRPAPLGISQLSDLAFFFSKAYQAEILTANPGILITGEPFVQPLQQAQLPIWKSAAIIACPDPYLAFALLSEKFANELSTVAHLPRKNRVSEIHPTAVIAPTAILGEGVKIGPYCVIEEEAKIGSGTTLYPQCYIGPRCSLGEDCTLFPNVTLYEWTSLGNRVRIHSGSVLGSDGFGYAQKRDGTKIVNHHKIYHLGRVVVGDDVEIGAITSIDRGTLGETRIDSKAKIDNQVHLGHNVKVGEGAILCGGSCLAGNASVGKFVFVGGLVGVDNQVHIGDGANVCAMSLVSKDVQPSGVVAGSPLRPHKEYFRVQAMLSKLLEERRKRS